MKQVTNSTKMDFKIDESKCINCGLCSSDCPVLIINNKTDFPTIKEGKEANCLKCQHCLAVCPTAALSIWGKNPEASIPATSAIPETVALENLMQTRRSIRKFADEEVDPELIHRLVSMASYAPTAKNENAVQFTVVDNKIDMMKLRELTYNCIKKAFEEERIPAQHLYLNNFQNVWETKQIDVIFRDAPHLLITSAPKEGTFPLMDCGIAMTYFDLLANTNGIGTLWDGFAKYAFEDVAPEMKARLGIPENHEVAIVLAFGKPAVKYARSIQNDSPAIRRVSL
ncbi:nitroreductase family protein [Mangrovibacterium sp.]|uniref:nitroreductase family protein n=1 Tax=Mangrovibacterium sp. TaxID=1961364 RepID=UPI0035613DD6